MEHAPDDRLASVGTCVHIKDDGSTKNTMNRKPTHTNQYLNFDSSHYLGQKCSVITTLLSRAKIVISGEEGTTLEIEHLESVLSAKLNNYKTWM